MQIQSGKTKAKKSLKKSILGGSWPPFVRGLGRAGASLGRSWALLGRFLGLQNQALLKDSSQMGSKRPSGSILAPFGGDFGRVLEGFRPNFEWVWEKIEEESGRILKNWPCWGRFSNWTPALVRSASQCAGVLPPA